MDERYIIYLRKSRADSPELTVEEVLAKHETQLQEYARHELGYEIPETSIYREVVSGETIDARPVMRNILSMMETGMIKGVLVMEPQRLSRGDLEDCGRIVNAFRYTNTFVMTPMRNFDISSEYDRKFFEMELTRGNDYLEYTKRVLNRGRIASVKKGNYIGNMRPFGYKKITRGSGKDIEYTLEPVEEEANAVRLMYQLFVSKNWGFQKIARHLDEIGIKPQFRDHWCPATIKDILENPLYIGKIRWNWRKGQKIIVDGKIKTIRPKQKSNENVILVDGKHEAIVDEDIYYAAVEKRGKNPAVRRNMSLENPFAGILKCRCGSCMSMKKYVNRRLKKDNKPVIISMVCNDQTHCHTHSAKYADILSSVITILMNDIKDIEADVKGNKLSEAEIKKHITMSLQAELESLKKKDQRQKEAYEDGIYTKEEFIVRNRSIREQIQVVSSKLSGELIIKPENPKVKLASLKELVKTLADDTVSAEHKNMLLKSVIDKIIYTNELESRPGIGRYLKNEFTLEIFMK